MSSYCLLKLVNILQYCYAYYFQKLIHQLKTNATFKTILFNFPEFIFPIEMVSKRFRCPNKGMASTANLLIYILVIESRPQVQLKQIELVIS